MLCKIGTQPITTPRLLLRRFNYLDYKKVYDSWAGEPCVTTHMRWSYHENKQESRRVVWGWCSHYREGDYLHWAIQIKATGELIGSIRLLPDTFGDDRAEVGYSTSPRHWGEGYATEALAAVVDYGFRKVGFHRIEGYCSVANPASGRVMERAGLRHEGTLRGYCKLHDGQYVDCDFYGVTKHDWPPGQPG